MARITKQFKESFVKSVTYDAISKREETLNIKRKLLEDGVYMHLVGSHLETMKSLPDGYFRKGGALRCAFGGRRYFLHMASDRVLPYEWADHREICYFPEEHELTRLCIEIVDEEGNLAELMRELRSNISALLASVKTDTQLLKVWPEANKYFQVSATTPQFPAIIDISNIVKLINQGKAK